MAGPDYLGEFELLTILALVRLEDRAYGVTIRREIHQRAGRDASIGAVYATLDRLEAKGFVKSKLGEPTAERGGRSKRFFHITARGAAALDRTRTALEKMLDGLEPARNLA